MLNSKGMLSRLMEKIVDNLQIELKNVHVRYEDSTTDPEVDSLVLGNSFCSLLLLLV